MRVFLISGFLLLSVACGSEWYERGNAPEEQAIWNADEIQGVPITLTSPAQYETLVFGASGATLVNGVVDAAKIATKTVTLTNPASGDVLGYNGSIIVNMTRSYTAEFDGALLVSDAITLTHGLDTTTPIVQVYSDSGVQWQPGVADFIDADDADNITIDFTTTGAITGTWTVRAMY